MPGADGARGKRPTDVTKSFSCLYRTTSFFSCVSSRRPRRPYVGYPNQFPPKKNPVGRPHHQVCPNTIAALHSTRHPQEAAAMRRTHQQHHWQLCAALRLLRVRCSAVGRCCQGWAHHRPPTEGTIPSTPARCPRPSAPPRYLWDLWQANVAPRAIKRTSWVHIWVPNHDSTPTRYCDWRDDRYEPPPLHNCGRGRGLPQRQEWWDGGRRVAGRPSPS